VYDPRLRQADRILIVRLGAIGDVLRVLPALARLRRERPLAEIGWAVEHWVAPLLEGHPLIDRLHVLDRKALKSGWMTATGEFRHLAAEIRRHDYQVLLDFHGRFKSGVLGRLTRIPLRVGYARKNTTEANHLFTNVHVELRDHWENRVLRFLHLLQPLGIDPSYEPGEHGLWVEPAAASRARAWYAEAGAPELAIYPGTSEPRRDERWPAEKYSELLGRLGVAGRRSMVFWGPAEEELARGIVAAAGEGAVLAPRTSLHEMMAMIGLFRAYLGSDTAAMHMAWMQGVPTAFFAGPKPVRTAAPLPPVRMRSLRRGDIGKEDGPVQRSPELVAAVTVEDAFVAAREMLGA
jgi:heptosyltransferase-1